MTVTSLCLGLDVSPKRREWTHDEETAVATMAKEGYSQGEIAKRTGRSENSVNLKLLRLGIRRRELRNSDATIKARFDRYVQVTDGCWWWRGPVQSNGYGSLWVRGKNVPAHRLAYEFANGPIPEGKLVCHRCDEPLCVRPHDLFLGTPADNNRDCVAKGRNATGERNGGGGKLTRAQVNEIRARYKPRVTPRRALAAEYGVSKGLIDQIVDRKVWL